MEESTCIIQIFRQICALLYIMPLPYSNGWVYCRAQLPAAKSLMFLVPGRGRRQLRVICRPPLRSRTLSTGGRHLMTQSLTSLVERAVNSNLDLKQAESRLRQARAARHIVSAGLWPTIDATGSYLAANPQVLLNSWRTGMIYGSRFGCGLGNGYIRRSAA